MGSSREQMVPKKAKDTWASFLEEIEAPMWVDLTQEANCYRQDNNDDWFRTSHLFHQCSSHQLKSMLACSNGEIMNLDFDSLGECSQELPSSVSRSRGKEYRSKKWKEDNCDASLNDWHTVKVLAGTSSRTGSGFCEEMRPKLSFVNTKGTSRVRASLVSGRSFSGNARINHVKTTSTGSGSGSSDKAGLSNTASTVTSDSQGQQQEKPLEVSSQAWGHTSELLSAVKITLRKSCVTRQAFRVEINNDRRRSRIENNNNRRQSGNRKSSSSKSSVGSSSNPLCDVNGSTCTMLRNKEQTLDSRNMARMTEVAKSRGEVPNLSKASTVQIKEGAYNSRYGCKATAAKSVNLKAAKSKAQPQSLDPKVLLKARVNKKNSSTGSTKTMEKMKVTGPNRPLGVGKENATGRMSMRQTNGGTQNVSGGMVSDQKEAKHSMPQKGYTTRLSGPKGKATNEREASSSTGVRPRVHFR